MTPCPDLLELRTRCRSGDPAAIRKLHFGGGERPEPDASWNAFMFIAAAEHRKMRGPETDHRRAVRPGSIDFHRLHCLALDRLDELLAFLLPLGTENASAAGSWCWFGSHPDRRIVVSVCLLSGSWGEPNTGKGGRDLVSLFAHLFGISTGRAAHMLAEWLGAEVRAYA